MSSIRAMFQQIRCPVGLHAWGDRHKAQDYYPALVGQTEAIIEKHKEFRECAACHLQHGQETTVIDRLRGPNRFTRWTDIYSQYPEINSQHNA